MPKVELHLHFEGSLRAETIFDLAERNSIELACGSPEALRSLYAFDDFSDFIELFCTGLDVLRTEQDFCEATVRLAAELAAQNVRYAEVTTTPWHHQARAIPYQAYAEGLNEGRRLARCEHGVELSWICDIPRNMEPADSTETLDFVLGPLAPDGIVALGLGGLESGFPPEAFAGQFKSARAAGLPAVPHAGETEGPQSVRGAVESLGAIRIGHGVRCLEDSSVVDLLIERRIPLEVCPTSNVKLGLADSHESHCLPDLLSSGLRVTLNTDDPAYFDVTLNEELQLAHDNHGVGIERLWAMQQLALEVSLAPDDTRRQIREELDSWRIPS